MAIDGTRSEFNAATHYTVIDTFKEMFELSPTDAQNVEQWKAFKAKGENMTAEERLAYEELSTLLAQKIMTAEDWNKLCDCMVNLEKLYTDKGLDEINTTVRDNIIEHAEQDIAASLGTIISNLLLTNATRIIVSETTPDYVEGALWVKPKIL